MCDFHLHSSLLAGTLKRQQIKVVSLDFDETILDIHTHSKWEDGPAKLAKHVRPFFLNFIPAVLRKGMVICVCTFSSQRKLIQQTLREAFGPTLARQILVRCQDGSWTPSPIETAPRAWYQCSRRGKMDHILSVVTKIYIQSGIEITPEQVLLIDDQAVNVHQARYDGVYAFVFDKEDPLNGMADENSSLFTTLMDTFRAQPSKGAVHKMKHNNGSLHHKSGSIGTSPVASKRSSKVEAKFASPHDCFNKFDDLCLTDSRTVESLKSTSNATNKPNNPFEWKPVHVRHDEAKCLPKACVIM